MRPAYSSSSCISPQYYEIYKHREVIGISILFMIIDLLGGVFSDLSLVFRPNFDVIAGVAYSLVVARTLPGYSTTYINLISLFYQGSGWYCDYTRLNTQSAGGTKTETRGYLQLQGTRH